MSYRVETEAGSEWRRHAGQILDSKLTDTKTSDVNIIEPNDTVEYSVTEQPIAKPKGVVTTSSSIQNNKSERRYPQRVRKPPKYSTVSFGSIILTSDVFVSVSLESRI
jgi:hypothetical protein